MKQNIHNTSPTVSTMIVIPQEEWLSIHDKLDRLAEMIETRNTSDRNAEWLESEAARKLLGVSPKTWQNYRDQRVIPFSQIGRKIYVNRADLDTFLRRYRIVARSPDSLSS